MRKLALGVIALVASLGVSGCGYNRLQNQDEAVKAISKALRRSRADLKDPRRPIGSFLFLGPTGVGKTYLARNLAEFMFGDADALIQIDMSEYMEKFTSSRLIGSPPGYVGYEEGGQLSEAVRRRPYSVVLFDEIEKAHPDVMNLLLQILEEGMVTDSLGRKIDFRNTIIILTSNVGASTIKRQTSLGFGAMSEDNADFEGMKEKILEESKRYFKPEFLNRLDDLVVFHMLEKKDLDQIVDLEIDKLPNEPEHAFTTRAQVITPWYGTAISGGFRWRGPVIPEGSGTGLLGFADETTHTDPSIQLDFRLAQPLFDDRIRLHFDVINVTDENREDSYAVRGRQFIAGISGEFGSER